MVAIPDKVAVPFPLSVRMTFCGRPVWPVPVEAINVGLGSPLVVTVKAPLVPDVKVVLLALVMLGAVPGAASTAPIEQFDPAVGRATPLVESTRATDRHPVQGRGRGDHP